MRKHIQAAAHYLLIPLKLLFAEPHSFELVAPRLHCRMLDSVRCCQIYPFYSSLPKHQAPANNSWLSTFLAPPPTKLTSSWPRHVVNVSRNHNPCPGPPSRVCSSHCHQIPASGLWPLPPPPPHPSMTPSWQVGCCSPDKTW